MERFYIVTKDTPIYAQYYLRASFEDRAWKLYCELAQENGIESKKILPRRTRLGIVPTVTDELKFNEQFIRKTNQDGIRFFKARSKINLSWMRLMDKNAVVYARAPVPNIDLGICYKGPYRLFDFAGNLYLSLKLDREYPDWDDPKGCVPIKAADFYSIIVKIAETEKIT